MRAREFITEQRDLPPESREPMRDTYILPGLSASDPYKSYRFGVAMARARSEYRQDDVNPYRLSWSAETAFGEHAIVAGFNHGVADIIDAALEMTETPGGKQAVSTLSSEEPEFVAKNSPINAFKGYHR